MRNSDFDCIIVGAGPGGLSAAIFLRRLLRSVAVVHTSSSRARWISKCHNLLGAEKEITGSEFLSGLWEQADELKVTSFVGSAFVRKLPNGFEVCSGIERLRARKIIFATGVNDRQPDWPNIYELRIAQVLRYCSICDGYEHRDEPIAVVAADEGGVREALFLHNFSDRIYLLFRGQPDEARELLSLAASKGIDIICAEVRSVSSRLEWGKPSVRVEFESSAPDIIVRAIYIALGVVVNHQPFAELTGLRLAPDGHIKVDERMQTSLDGVFAVGDCTEGLSQILTATSDAARAAHSIHSDLCVS